MLIRISKLIKTIIFSFIRFSGILRIWIYLNRNKINILMLHGVMDTDIDSSWNPLWNRVSRAKIDRCLGMLSRYYKFISFDDAVDMLSGKKKMEQYCIAVTFDDGYRNNIRHALPILAKHGITATIFVSTGYISDRKPYSVDRLDYALQNTNVNNRTIEVGNKSIVISASSREDLAKSYHELRVLFREQYNNEILCKQQLDELTSKLENECGKALSDIFETDDWSGLLTWDEIRETNHAGVVYGSHTVDHYRLAQLSTEEIHHQLARSKSILENELSEQCKHICYPVGSFNTETMRLSKDCGYESGVTTEPGLNKPGDNLFSLKRISFPSKGSDDESILHLTGLLESLSKVKSKIMIN